MSLFKTRDLWSTTCDNDLFDLGCIRVANLGLGLHKKNLSIVTGSYNGFLRIYNPSDANELNSDNKSSFKAHDLICETSFPAPILQIEIGRFVSTSNKQHIAVLLSKKLAVYEVIEFEQGNVEHGNQFSLKFIYEHVLQRNAFNMCKGSFGGVNSSSNNEPHEYICVQSMDGMLSVFEYESFSLSCFLPKVLLPGPFKYVSKTDSFVTVSSSWELECYRYQVLASSAKTYERNQESNAVKLKKILPEYKYNLGEAAIDIEILNQVSNTGQSSCSILVLGERNLFCLSETCVLKFTKKFDYNPSSFCAYPVISSSNQTIGKNSVNFIIATHSKLLLIHEDIKVKWAAQVDHVPVQIQVAKINDLNGVIVTLSEDGQLKCSYLGTEPAFINPVIKDDSNKPFDYQVAENEYRQLQSKIKSAIMNTGSVLTNVNKSGLIIKVDVPNQIDALTPNNRNKDTELKDQLDAIPSLTCKIMLRSAETVQNVKLTVNCHLPIVAVPDSVFYSSIGSNSYEQEVCFYMKTKHIPCNLDVNVCVTYSYSAVGATKINETKFRLPLKLVMKSGQQIIPQKTDLSDDLNSDSKSNIALSNFKKIILESSRPCVNLCEIFPEFASSFSQANGNTLAAQYYGHPNINISIQGAKAGSNRYRILSDNYDSIWLVVQEFFVRLQHYYLKQSQEIKLSYNENFPIEEFKLLIDKHLALRQSLEVLKENLEQSCVQFRAIQKRLLTKFKDKSPTSLDNMDALLEATYRQITLISDNYISNQKELSLITNSINCMSNLYAFLIGLTFKLSKDGLEILESVMTNNLTDTADLGWEETVTAAISNLIRTGLSKQSSKDTAAQQLSYQLKLPQDSTKLEKQISSLTNKLESGATLVSSVYKKKISEVVSENTKTQQDQPTRIASKPSAENSQPSTAQIKPTLALEPQPKAPVAQATHSTMGEDWNDNEDAY